MEAKDPIHAEALALKEAMEYISIGGLQYKYVLLSDSKALVQAVTGGQDQMGPSWDAAETIAWCSRFYHNNRATLQVLHVHREAITIPHTLANWARRTSQVFQGHPLNSPNCLPIEQTTLNQEYYRIAVMEGR